MSGARRAIGAIAVAVLVLAPACSNDDGPDKVTPATSHTDGTGTHTGGGEGEATTTTKPATTTTGMAHDHGATTTTAFKATQASDSVPIEAREYSFVGAPATITGPKVFFTLVNKGKETHELVIRDGDGTSYGEIPDLAPGAKGDLAVELQPGTYSIACLVKAGTRTHEELGMKATFAVS